MPPAKTSPKSLSPVEIKTYKGKQLSSINDFRENSIKGPQYIDKKRYRLAVKGLVAHPGSYSYGEVVDAHQHYEKAVTLNCVEGWSVTILWEGVLVRDLLRKAVPSAKAKSVIFRSHEGYSTSFPLSYIMDRPIMMAYKMNGVILPPERGFPFQLVAEDKWGYKWIKWITEIELSDDTQFRGYWESRGYSNGGDLGESFLGK